jgi:hypothetical protein
MTGTTTDVVDPSKMTNAELHAQFTQLLGGHAHDVDARLGDVDFKLIDAWRRWMPSRMLSTPIMMPSFRRSWLDYRRLVATRDDVHAAFLLQRCLRVPLLLHKPPMKHLLMKDMMITEGRTSG